MKKLTKPQPSKSKAKKPALPKRKPGRPRKESQPNPANENSEGQSPREPLTSSPPSEMTTAQTITEALPPELRVSEAAHGGTSDAHLDTIVIPPDASADAAAAAAAVDVANDNIAQANEAKGIVILQGPNGEQISIVDRATFRKSFYGMFKAGGMFLQSLPIRQDEIDLANEACDAIYDTCCEVHWLHVILKPGGVWLPRLMAIYFFADAKVAGVLAELKARRELQSQPAAA